jgi:hypothetical protein
MDAQDEGTTTPQTSPLDHEVMLWLARPTPARPPRVLAWAEVTR